MMVSLSYANLYLIRGDCLKKVAAGAGWHCYGDGEYCWCDTEDGSFYYRSLVGGCALDFIVVRDVKFLEKYVELHVCDLDIDVSRCYVQAESDIYICDGKKYSVLGCLAGAICYINGTCGCLPLYDIRYAGIFRVLEDGRLLVLDSNAAKELIGDDYYSYPYTSYPYAYDSNYSEYDNYSYPYTSYPYTYDSNYSGNGDSSSSSSSNGVGVDEYSDYMSRVEELFKHNNNDNVSGVIDFNVSENESSVNLFEKFKRFLSGEAPVIVRGNCVESFSAVVFGRKIEINLSDIIRFYNAVMAPVLKLISIITVIFMFLNSLGGISITGAIVGLGLSAIVTAILSTLFSKITMLNIPIAGCLDLEWLNFMLYSVTYFVFFKLIR